MKIEEEDHSILVVSLFDLKKMMKLVDYTLSLITTWVTTVLKHNLQQ